MTNTLTVEQLQELLKIQKEFDDRIPTLNLQDSKIAYVVEFFEWFNTLETFKNWKKKRGKPLEVQLDELADLLAFGLSIANQVEKDTESILDNINDGSFNDFLMYENVNFDDFEVLDSFLVDINDLMFCWYGYNLFLPFAIANHYYTIDQLITAYKKKMEINHARQDGTADADKGYV
ncbi:dUTP diphosphatase [Staphylococcus pseudintermedius]|uniref:dUTPase n=1 Tax=Staphylococcus pseudintermedius TaxID=283734 RepID=A0A8H9BY89_STAPS|nr:dUTP diphosphatase [Staphylococcus pseudintermedius]EGQ0317839.1 dUTPase [Staphylococcus pseudintermedius]EGQ0383541.1 dUTPase [Staphylococcus pseudintermedius]EGQ1284430.1 dUTPase [Staphylococcus pseudintermedius]EGQ1317904.1 dUTPase [Staphylococcus pseudintermedius]EGQ2838068.1 dUTPase [Staphylococcus pseudintermedius]